VIVTASPVLTNEIRRFYGGLKDKIISELKKRDERRRKKEQAEGEFEVVEEEKDSSPQKELRMEGEDEVAEEDLENELVDAEEMEKNLNIPHSMHEMRNEDFPCFLTIKRLVYMIDASINRPFFARNL